jgi:hypothetical protein
VLVDARPRVAHLARACSQTTARRQHAGRTPERRLHRRRLWRRFVNRAILLLRLNQQLTGLSRAPMHIFLFRPEFQRSFLFRRTPTRVEGPSASGSFVVDASGKAGGELPQARHVLRSHRVARQLAPGACPSREVRAFRRFHRLFWGLDLCVRFKDGRGLASARRFDFRSRRSRGSR